MTRIVTDLSDVARLETNQLRLEMYRVPVQEVIDETVRVLQGLIDEKQQILEFKIEDSVRDVWADQTRIIQVLTNLLSNAHKYTPEEGTIIIGAHEETVTDEETGTSQQMIHTYCKDTGIGMSPEDLEKLFTKFFRTDAGKEMAKGTGLGLVITKNLIERHGGDIWVDSEVGQGTTFHFTLPLADDHETKEESTVVSA